MRTAARRRRACTGCSPAARCGCARRRCAPGATRTASGRRGPPPAVEPAADGVRGRGRVPRSPARAATPAGSGGGVRTTARRRPAGWPRPRTSGTPGGFRAALRAARRRARGARRWAGDLARRRRRGRGGGRRGPAPRQPGGGRRGAAGRRGGRRPGPGRRRVRRRTAGRPRRGGRLPVVRRLVARHDDRLRGAVPRHRPAPTRGASCCARTPATLSEGMLANTADTGRTRVQHRRRARCGSCTRSTGTSRPPATTTWPPSCCRRSTTVVDAHLRRHPLRHPGRPGRRAAHPGRPGRGADLDGRPGRRGAGDPAGRQGGRGQRAVDQRAGRASAGLRERLGRDATDGRRRARHGPRRRSGAASRRRPAGCTTWWTPGPAYPLAGPHHDDDRCAPTSCSPGRLPYAPLRAGPSGAAAGSAHALLTPLGLRSLAPGAPGYRGRHRGGPAERDRAYHQGTVWPWLIGPYVDARRRAGLPTMDVLRGLIAHLGEWGLGSVSETADGDAPHAATGCPFQAWSVGGGAARPRQVTTDRYTLATANSSHLLAVSAGSGPSR